MTAVVRCTLLVAVFLSGTAVAQEDMEDISASGLLAKAGQLLSAEKYDVAIPYMTTYVDRMCREDDERILSMVQEVRLKLGKIAAFQGDPGLAADYFMDYMESLPRYKPREVLKLLALNLYELEEYEEVIATVTNALTQPPPTGFSEEVKQVEYENLSESERGGLSARQLKRYDEEAKEGGEDLSQGFSRKGTDAEPAYSVDELVQLNMAMAQSYTALEEWRACLEPYQFVIDNSTDESRRGYATMETVNALVALEEFQEAGVFVEKLYRTDARYDIRVNMALMSAASALFNAEEYDNALKLYRMVLSRTDLVAHLETKMNEVSRRVGLPDVQLTVVTNTAGRIETLFGYKNLDISKDSTASMFGGALPPKPPEMLALEEAVATLVSLPPYEDDALYRIGQLYAAAGRPWEAVAALEMVADQDPDGLRGQQAMAEYLQVLVDPLQKYELVERLGKTYLDKSTEGLGPRVVAHALTTSYQKQETWGEVKKLIPYIENFAVSDEQVIRQYECELYYMQAIADLVLLDYAGAKVGFSRLMADFPESHQQENSVYWHAMVQLFLKHQEEALAEFQTYIQTYPEGSRMASVVFHSGICLFGLEKYDEAGKQFTAVIERYPDSAVYCDALSMRGDLRASLTLLDEAQSDYELAIEKAREPRQATYAVFQLAAMFELEDRYQEILDLVTAYLDRYGVEADVAKGAFWIGKTRLAQGQVDKAVEAYRDSVVKYGGEVKQDGVDLIIAELVKVSKQRLETDEREALKESLRTALEETEHVTLQLRLRVILAMMEGTEIELGKELILELEDLAQAPPPVLGVICDASFEQKDYSRAEELLDLFQTRYEDSNFIRAALQLRGVGLFSEGAYEEALKVAGETQEIYGTDPSAAWAQIIKGRAELQMGNLDAARKTFREATTVRDWRGETYAQAMYYLGQTEEAAGNLRKAFGWHQRVSLLYKGYANGFWAAESYLASARCLQALGFESDMRNTYRAMLFDKHVNTLPQAEGARRVLGADEVLEINEMIAAGTQTNLMVNIDVEGGE